MIVFWMRTLWLVVTIIAIILATLNGMWHISHGEKIYGALWILIAVVACKK